MPVSIRPRFWFLGVGSIALVACGSCQKDSASSAVDGASEASLPTTTSEDGGPAKATLAAFASKDDLTSYFQKIVRDEDEAKTLAQDRRAGLVEAGVDGSVMFGDQIGDSFGGGGLGLSGTGQGGGGSGDGVGLGSIGTIGHGAGSGTGSGYGSGSGRFSATPKSDKALSITNTQVEGVDEGDIVKPHGDYLVVLRRGRLFTIKIGGDSLAPTASSDAFAPDLEPRGAWYDEMIVWKDTVAVIGYSYSRGGTEIGLFDLDAQGGIKYRATYHLRGSDYYSSRNYASRLLGNKLVFYSPAAVSARDQDPFSRFPALRKWKNGADTSGFASVLEPTRISKPLVPASYMTLHSVTVCSLAEPELQCTSRGVLGPPGRVFHVSEDSVYVWTTPYSPFRQKKRPQDGKALPQDAGTETVAARSYLYRLPLDGSEPTVLRASGAPVDQFSFHQSGGHLNVLVRESGQGDAMWAAEGTTKAVALFRVPLTAFAREVNTAPESAYTTLPGVEGYALQNRFVGDFVLYGTGSGWRGTRETAERKVTAYRYASQDGKTAQVLPLDHVIDRIEPIGNDALVVGARDKDLVFSALSLRGKTAEARGRYVRKNASQGETRSHGFFYKPEDDTSGMFGLPLRGDDDVGQNQLVSGSASIVFVKNDALAFKELGSVTARPAGSANDGCRASCADWYGNARPIFLGDRIVALLGYEVVEAKLEGGQLRERRRVTFAPRPGGATGK